MACLRVIVLCYRITAYDFVMKDFYVIEVGWGVFVPDPVFLSYIDHNKPVNKRQHCKHTVLNKLVGHTFRCCLFVQVPHGDLIFHSLKMLPNPRLVHYPSFHSK